MTEPMARPPMTRPPTAGPEGRSGRPVDQGQVTAFIVIMTVGLLLVVGLVLDGGLALRTKVEAITDAQAAARAGAGQLDLATYRATGQVRLDPARAVEAARAYLAATGTRSAADPTITVRGDRITVTVTRDQPTQLLGLAGLGALPVEGTGQARAVQGVQAPG